MNSTSLLVFCWLFLLVGGRDLNFPPWFKFGTATSSYQVEGAWNVSDKSESIWDRFVHHDPIVVADLTNGDVACDSYSLWKRDVEMVAELGSSHYRFSISWPRLLPGGLPPAVSAAGARYYGDLIDALLARGVEPIVTLYHWDLPQRLQDLGGWTNPLIADWFTDYSRVVFSLYGDRVKTWITINEPNSICDAGYMLGLFPPAVEDDFAPYLCTKNIMLAHAKVWRLYDTQYKPMFKGKVSIANDILWLAPQGKRDANLARLARDFMIGRYSYPIYSKEGGWPPAFEKTMKEISLKEGKERSRVPEFSKEEVELIRGTYDFYALNYYTCRLVRRARPGEKIGIPLIDGIPELRAVFEMEPGAVITESETLVICPHGLRDTASYLKQEYGDLEILITENGYSSAGSNLQDVKRAEFIKEHLEQLLLSIHEDGVNITGYTYWALMDNLEWLYGLSSKFGLYEVDFNSALRTRTPRYSASYFSQVIRTGSLSIVDRTLGSQ